MKKWAADWTWGMLAIIQCRIFCLPVCYANIWRLKYTALQFCPLFCMGVRLGQSHWGMNVGWERSGIGYWGRGLGVRGTRKLRSGEDCIMRSSLICTPQQVLFRWQNQEEWDGCSVWYVEGQGKVHTGFWWGNLRERDQLEDPGIDGRIILKLIFKKLYGGIDWIDLTKARDWGWALIME